MTSPEGSRDNPIPRQAGRVLLVDAGNRVLLVRGADPGRPGSRYWFTVGGGLDAGETVREAAARELFEETGLTVPPTALGDPVRHDVTDFPYEGAWYRQRQEFFLLRVPAWEVPVARLLPDEEHAIHEHRWWSLDELAATAEQVYPADLPALLTTVLTV